MNEKCAALFDYLRALFPEATEEFLYLAIWNMDLTAYRDLGKSLTDTVWIKTETGVRPAEGLKET